MAGETFKRVTDLKNVDRGYIAVKEIGAETVSISKAGNYTMNLSNFDWDLDRIRADLPQNARPDSPLRGTDSIGSGFAHRQPTDCRLRSTACARSNDREFAGQVTEPQLE